MASDDGEEEEDVDSCLDMRACFLLTISEPPCVTTRRMALSSAASDSSSPSRTPPRVPFEWLPPRDTDVSGGNDDGGKRARMVERWPAASRTRRRAEDRASVEVERREHQLFVLGVKAAYDAICIEEAELERALRAPSDSPAGEPPPPQVDQRFG